MVKCPKCGGEMKHLYSEIEIKKQGLNPFGELEARRVFICSNKECSTIKRLSDFEIVKEFILTRKKEGLSFDEILTEFEDKKEEIIKQIEKKGDNNVED